MSSQATDSFNSDPDQLRKLAQHENPDVALAAKLTLKHRYGEEVSL